MLLKFIPFLNVFCQHLSYLVDGSQDWCLTSLSATTQRQSRETMTSVSAELLKQDLAIDHAVLYLEQL